MAGKDYKPILIDQLSILEKSERQAKNLFKARAYSKVLQEIKGIPGTIGSADKERIAKLPGVGKKLEEKIREIFETGELHQAKDVENKSAFKIGNALLKIYGVGPVKAEELIHKHDIRSLSALRRRQEELLNEKQQIGLKYYDDINERIPRTEMKKHEKTLLTAMKTVDARFKGEIVGSYRREAADSGDIDFLVTIPKSTASSKEITDAFQRLIQYLMGGIEYVTDILAVGPKKFMGICRLGTGKARRLDILLTPEEEYPYAVLYFTGSDKFNVGMRRGALELGYTMNEHGMKPTKKTGTGENVPLPPIMADEEDIFKFLGYKYVLPKNRTDASILIKK